MKKYTKYFIELVVIVAGITISFMLDEWREESQKRDASVKSLKVIVDNLESDLENLHIYERWLSKQTDFLKIILKKRENVPDSLLIDSFWQTFQVSSEFSFQESGLRSFESIEGAIIYDSALQQLVDDYYENSIFNTNIRDWHAATQRIDEYKVNNLEFFDELMLIVSDESMDRETQNDRIFENEQLIKSIQMYYADPIFRNLVADKLLNLQFVVGSISQKIEKNKTLQQVLIAEIKK